MIRSPTPPPDAGTDELVNYYRRRSTPLFSRKDFHRLSFPDDVTTRQRITWKNSYQHKLQQDVGIPTRNPVALRYVYVQRSKPHVIDALKRGMYGDINFVCSDESAESAPKYRHFIIKGFPTDEQLELLHVNLGDTLNKHVHKFIRIQRGGQPTFSVRMIWKSH